MVDTPATLANAHQKTRLLGYRELLTDENLALTEKKQWSWSTDTPVPAAAVAQCLRGRTAV